MTWLACGALVIFLAGQITSLVKKVRGDRDRSEISPQPLSVKIADEFVAKGSCKTTHADLSRRLDGHDEEIKGLWETLRAEDNETRKSLAAAVRDFDQTVNRIDGTLESVKKLVHTILEKMMRNQKL